MRPDIVACAVNGRVEIKERLAYKTQLKVGVEWERVS